MIAGMKNLPESYRSGGWSWKFVELIENWAIYRKEQPASCKTSPSHEVVRANVRDFPPQEDAWGTDGFSFTDPDSLSNARTHICKLLASRKSRNCKNHATALAVPIDTEVAIGAAGP